MKMPTFFSDLLMVIATGILLLNSDSPWWVFVVIMVFGIFQRITGVVEGWTSAWEKYERSYRNHQPIKKSHRG